MISIKRSSMFLLMTLLLLVGIGILFIIYIIINLSDTLFKEQSVDSIILQAYVIPFHLVIILISAVILCTLAYVSWRKYRAFKAKEKRRNLKD